jgi:hypothetical protein
MFDEYEMFEDLFAGNNACPKLGDALHNEYDPLIPSTFDKKIYYDDSMPPIYDDYNDESGFRRVSTLGSNNPTILEGVESYYNIDGSGFGEVMTLFSDSSTILEEVSIDYDNKVAIYDYYYDDMYAIKSNISSMLVHHEKSIVCDSYIIESIHDASKNYYERGTYALTYLNNIKFLLCVLIVLKLYLFCLPMLVGSCSLAHKTPKHRKWVRLRCV